ncbi:MAG: hypothetical protein IBX55_20820 [Methyloprofundus sp.]|nr:hypothetical protein [Methyloprofundus sp.]
MLDIFDYLHQQTLSKEFALNYINKFERFLKQVLIQFPEAGTPMTQYGKGIRRIVYQLTHCHPKLARAREGLVQEREPGKPVRP